MIQQLDMHVLQLDCWRDAIADAEERIAEANAKLETATGSREAYWLKRLRKAEKDLTRAQRALKRVNVVK
jgi:hypothetical protein